jgi:hypothetical protein
MEELMQKLVDQVGIDRATAENVNEYLDDHAHDVVQALSRSNLAEELLGGKLGGLL